MRALKDLYASFTGWTKFLKYSSFDQDYLKEDFKNARKSKMV
jgi:hypothetical protein